MKGPISEQITMDSEREGIIIPTTKERIAFLKKRKSEERAQRVEYQAPVIEEGADEMDISEGVSSIRALSEHRGLFTKNNPNR